MAIHARDCQVCDGIIPAYTTAYSLRLQLFAEAGPLDLTPDDLAEDHERRMKEIVEQAKGQDPQDLMDEVFESYTLTVCLKCREKFHDDFHQFLGKMKDEI